MECYRFRKAKSYFNHFWFRLVKSGCGLLGHRSLKLAVTIVTWRIELIFYMLIVIYFLVRSLILFCNFHFKYRGSAADTSETLLLIWYHLHNLKNMEELKAEACNFNKSNTTPWVFFTFFKWYKWYQIAQSITCNIFLKEYLWNDSPVFYSVVTQDKWVGFYKTNHLNARPWWQLHSNTDVVGKICVITATQDFCEHFSWVSRVIREK